MKKLTIFSIIILHILCFCSDTPLTTGNLVTINGVLHRQLPNSDYWLSADQKMPGCWVIWPTMPDNKTGKPLPQAAIIMYGLAHQITHNNQVIYPEHYLQQITDHAHKFFKQGAKFSHRDKALQTLRELHKHPTNKAALFKLTHKDHLGVITECIQNK